MSKPKNPPGWYTLPVEVATDGVMLIIVGDPPDEEDDPSCEAHHCDSMGCRQSHVLASLVMSEVQREGLAHLIRAGRAKEEAAQPQESIRERVLRRLGKNAQQIRDRMADGTLEDWD